jgi:hypothetical protein
MDFKREDLEKIIKEQLNIPTISPLINRQIGKYVTGLGYSYKEIAQALVFYLEVDNGVFDPKYGIGIVPYVIDRSRAFFEQKRREKEEQIKSLINKGNQVDIILKPEKLQEKKKIRKINIEELEV